jgi:hypothetical protein
MRSSCKSRLTPPLRRSKEFSSIGYEIFKFEVDGVYREDGIFADVGVTMFQAGVVHWDQRFKEFCVFGGNGGLRRGYIRSDVARDNHHKIS